MVKFERVQETKRQRYFRLFAQLDRVRSNHMDHWMDLGENYLPRRTEWLVQDADERPQIRSKSIINTSPLEALRVLSTGMNSGITNSARPWFRLTTQDPNLADFEEVKDWLHVVTQRMATMFLRSNLYSILPGAYKECGVFGTSVIFVEEDDDTILFFRSLPIGSYWLGCDQKGQTRVFYRKFRMTVRQVIEKFAKRGRDGEPDFSNISDAVRIEYQNNNLEAWVEVHHVVEPNDEYDPDRLESKFKRFRSCYFEYGVGSFSKAYFQGKNDDIYLRESGYDDFPVLAFIWEKVEGDSYGTSCPGIDALPDVKQLQSMEKRKAQALELKVMPPMNASPSLRAQKLSLLPRSTNWALLPGGQSAYQPTLNVNFDIRELEADIRAIEARIDRLFYKHVFQFFSSDDRADRPTAAEVNEVKLEKLSSVGGVLEQANLTLLTPLIDWGFNTMLRRGLVPPPPRQLRNQPLKIEYVSVMALAQKASQLGGMERFHNMIANMAALKPTVLDKLNSDKFINEYADAIGMTPNSVNSDDEADAIRQQREQINQQQAAAQGMETIKMGAEAAKTLSETDLEKDSALKALVDKSRAGALV
jgi:hypothetical protein